MGRNRALPPHLPTDNDALPHALALAVVALTHEAEGAEAAATATVTYPSTSDAYRRKAEHCREAIGALEGLAVLLEASRAGTSGLAS